MNQPLVMRNEETKLIQVNFDQWVEQIKIHNGVRFVVVRSPQH
jgi:hypothetical protein